MLQVSQSDFQESPKSVSNKELKMRVVGLEPTTYGLKVW